MLPHDEVMRLPQRIPGFRHLAGQGVAKERVEFWRGDEVATATGLPLRLAIVAEIVIVERSIHEPRKAHGSLLTNVGGNFFREGRGGFCQHIPFKAVRGTQMAIDCWSIGYSHVWQVSMTA